MEDGVRVRPAVVAGSFYPGERGELERELEKLFKGTKRWRVKGRLKGLIVPHAGYIYSGKTAAWGYRQLRGKLKSEGHVVLVGPSHSLGFSGLVGSESRAWETPLGKVKQMEPKPCGQVVIDERVHEMEHSLEVQLPFLQYVGDKFSITGFLTGLALAVEEAASYFLENYPRSILVVSSDLSHYLPEEEAREKDKRTIEAILGGESRYFEREENAACGAEGILILMELAKRKGWEGKLIKYATSGEASGDKERVVGYAAIGFYL